MLDIIFKHLPAWLGMYRATSTSPKPNFKNGFQVNGSDYTATELNSALGGGVPATAGTVTASKPVIVDSNKDVTGFRSVEAAAFDVGLATGNSPTPNIDFFPPTSAKGYLRIQAADNAGDTATTITNASQAGARTYIIPDASTKTSADSDTMNFAMMKVVADVTNRPGALGTLLYATGNNKLYVCTAASATAATWTIVGTQT